ncbi:hypothetical protein SISSUDRAFT_1092916 [Sistotremastrum suecicum HHB10207 ss-3]|uniref:Uncharacterized protein n=1 Tax=Sistotremastrum suecicum HHB10207 ss-3 TaxID=1314776 RepID=A0A165XW69_9AGAM|nr:hypothetical protein SISSUDRAFT_1092916 [Sistotremastrum suecicum HHB10207 ss-3]
MSRGTTPSTSQPKELIYDPDGFIYLEEKERVRPIPKTQTKTGGSKTKTIEKTCKDLVARSWDSWESDSDFSNNLFSNDDDELPSSWQSVGSVAEVVHSPPAPSKKTKWPGETNTQCYALNGGVGAVSCKGKPGYSGHCGSTQCYGTTGWGSRCARRFATSERITYCWQHERQSHQDRLAFPGDFPDIAPVRPAIKAASAGEVVVQASCKKADSHHERSLASSNAITTKPMLPATPPATPLSKSSSALSVTKIEASHTKSRREEFPTIESSVFASPPPTPPPSVHKEPPKKTQKNKLTSGQTRDRTTKETPKVRLPPPSPISPVRNKSSAVNVFIVKTDNINISLGSQSTSSSIPGPLFGATAIGNDVFPREKEVQAKSPFDLSNLKPSTEVNLGFSWSTPQNIKPANASTNIFTFGKVKDESTSTPTGFPAFTFSGSNPLVSKPVFGSTGGTVFQTKANKKQPKLPVKTEQTSSALPSDTPSAPSPMKVKEAGTEAQVKAKSTTNHKERRMTAEELALESMNAWASVSSTSSRDSAAKSISSMPESSEKSSSAFVLNEKDLEFLETSDSDCRPVFSPVWRLALFGVDLKVRPGLRTTNSVPVKRRLPQVYRLS